MMMMMMMMMVIMTVKMTLFRPLSFIGVDILTDALTLSIIVLGLGRTKLLIKPKCWVS